MKEWVRNQLDICCLYVDDRDIGCASSIVQGYAGGLTGIIFLVTRLPFFVVLTGLW